MSSNTQTFLVFTAVFLFIYKYVTKDRHINLPPGPPSLPIVGSLPWLGEDLREPLEKMKHKYGDVFTIYLGKHRTVMLNSYDAIKEAYVKYGNAYVGRPQEMFLIKYFSKGRGMYCRSSVLEMYMKLLPCLK